MKKAVLMMIVVLLNASCACTCIHATEEAKKDYGALAMAVTFSSDKVIGEYGNRIPDTFTAESFMRLVEHKIPDKYYAALKGYKLVVEPKSKYYLLKVYDPKNGSLIMFDYSCTPELDGPVYQNPQKFDVNDLAKYDKCSSHSAGKIASSLIYAGGIDGFTALADKIDASLKQDMPAITPAGP